MFNDSFIDDIGELFTTFDNAFASIVEDERLLKKQGPNIITCTDSFHDQQFEIRRITKYISNNIENLSLQKLPTYDRSIGKDELIEVSLSKTQGRLYEYLSCIHNISCYDNTINNTNINTPKTTSTTTNTFANTPKTSSQSHKPPVEDSDFWPAIAAGIVIFSGSIIISIYLYIGFR